MKIAIILGTRPEIIKMGSIIREYERWGLDHCILKQCDSQPLKYSTNLRTLS